MTEADRYRRALVLGLGASGMAAARLLLGEGARVTVVDSGDGDELRRRAAALEAAGARVLLGAAELPRAPGPAEEFDACVVSPGVDGDSDWVRACRQRGIAVLPELELGMSRTRCRVLAVTGSNGKSTMVKLCSESLAEAGLRAVPAANYGRPLSEVASGTNALDWVVAEVSSFQMETVRRFRPAVAVLLNIHPNHLDRHPDMAAYTALKTRIFADLRTRDHGVAPLGLAGAARGAGGTCRLTTFGVEPGADFRYAAGRVRYAAATGEEEISFDGTHFANDILGLTAAAASAAMRACGVDTRCVELAARRFEPLPHRMAEVAVVRGVRFVDDSKATNLAATAAAVRMCGGPVRLIAGGLLKETELRPAIEPLAGTVRAAYLIGDAARKLEGAWREVIPCSVCGDLRSAVREAWKEARGGETVLLAPGCASFDQFRGYDERGERFHDAVQDIAREA